LCSDAQKPLALRTFRGGRMKINQTYTANTIVPVCGLCCSRCRVVCLLLVVVLLLLPGRVCLLPASCVPPTLSLLAHCALFACSPAALLPSRSCAVVCRA
jgi:hypothetical protein